MSINYCDSNFDSFSFGTGGGSYVKGIDDDDLIIDQSKDYPIGNYFYFEDSLLTKDLLII